MLMPQARPLSLHGTTRLAAQRALWRED